METYGIRTAAGALAPLAAMPQKDITGDMLGTSSPTAMCQRKADRHTAKA